MSYFIVHDWMITKLKLKGLERDIFAIIYRFSPEKNTGAYYGSLEYLSNTTGYDKASICRTLSKLVEKKLILKQETFQGSIKHCEYKINHKTIDKISTDRVEKVNGAIDNLSTNHLQKVNGTVDKMSTNSISDNKEIGERDNISSLSKVSNTQNNSESTAATSELDLFSTELINIFREFTASDVRTLENVNALKDQAKRVEFLELFNNASGDWREAIKHAKKLTSKSNKIGTLKWLDFLDYLKLLLKNRTVDGVNFIKKILSETDKLKLEKEKQERDKQEAITQAKAELERKLEASRLGISVDELDDYKMRELKKKLLGKCDLDLDLEKDKEVCK